MDIRFYAGAADAAGTSATVLDPVDLTAAELRDQLCTGNPALTAVLGRCTLLVDGHPVRDSAERIPGTARVDVLPPFAGG